jgi:hypothetical protein
MNKLLSILLFLLSINIFSNTGLGVSGIGGGDADLTIGPSLAIMNNSNAEKLGKSFNFDIAMTWGLFTASSNFKLIDTNGVVDYGVQLELTFWFFVNIGGGVGYLFGDNENIVKHFFVGAPIPTFKRIKIKFLRGLGFNDFVIEPYYRLNFFNDDKIHEFGLMFKVTTWKG